MIEFGTPPTPFPKPDSPVVVLLCAGLLVESTDARGPGTLVSIEPFACPIGSISIRFAYICVLCLFFQVKIGTDLCAFGAIESDSYSASSSEDDIDSPESMFFVRRYKTILPMVKQQVESQIKVRDLSNAKLSIEPADSTSWSDVRTDLIAESKNKLRAELELELAAAPSEAGVEALRSAFSVRERRLEHDVDSKIHTFSATVDVEYNFLAK